MSAGAVINSQDWYRLRRGEDQIAWGRCWTAADLPGVVFSERARAEFAFLEAEQREALRTALRNLDGAAGQPVAHGEGRRVLSIAGLRVIFRADADRAWISTIRGGPVLDPEHTGPAPDEDTEWTRA
jgi:hypothetical protein